MLKKTISNNEILELYSQGFSQKDILKNYKVSIPRLRNTLQKSGYTTTIYKKFDDEFILAILNLLCMGYKQNDIALILDFPLTTIRDMIHKYQLQGIAINARKIIREKELLELYKSGMKKSEICKIMKIQMSSLNKILKANGLLIDKKKRTEQIIKLHKQGLTISAICSTLNTSYRTVKKAIMEEGVENE